MYIVANEDTLHRAKQSSKLNRQVVVNKYTSLTYFNSEIGQLHSTRMCELCLLK